MPKTDPKNDSPFITTGERVRNFVGIAFVLSILLHLMVAPLFPDLTKHHETSQVEKVALAKKIKVRVPTPPPPTPTPAPTPTPPPNATPPPKVAPPQPKPMKVHLVHQTNNNASGSTENTVSQPKTGSENGVPQAQGTAAATSPPATPAPACANPNVDATVTNAMHADYPNSALDLGLGDVTVQVEVTVGPSGNLTDAKIYKTANNMAMDQAALRAARQSTYAPKLVNCVPTTGSYLFTVDFTTNG